MGDQMEGLIVDGIDGHRYCQIAQENVPKIMKNHIKLQDLFI